MINELQIINDPATGEDCVDALRVVDLAVGLNHNVLDHGYINLVDFMPRLIPADIRTADGAIAEAARSSYQKGTKRVRGDAGLVDYLIRKLHTSPIEMIELKFAVRAPLFVARQWVR